MVIECPAPGCAHRFRGESASLVPPAGHLRLPSTTTCPTCGRVIQLGLLVLESDEVWRVSRFAGHADDVQLTEPPGGYVSYDPAEPSDADALAAGLAASELEARQRALSAITGCVSGVGPAAQRDAVELALELGVLGQQETARARAWLERR